MRYLIIKTAVFSLLIGTASARLAYAQETEIPADWVSHEFTLASYDSPQTACPHAEACPHCQSDDCWTRPTMTGDWHGCRTDLQKQGILFRGSLTHFGFGVSGGVNGPATPAFGQGDTFNYTGHGEYDWIFDLEKFGGLPKGKLLIGFQHWWGEFGNVSLKTGSFPPTIFAAALPPEKNDPGNLFLTDFLYTQPLSEQLIIFAGKKNIVGTADQTFFSGGDGTNQFINQALVANPAFLLALPYSSFTVGAVCPRKWGAMSIYVFDPTDRTDQFLSGIGEVFSEGVIVGSEVKVNTNFFSKPGEHHVGGIWKHTNLVDLRVDLPEPEYPYPPAPPGAPVIKDSFTLYYGFDQYVHLYRGKKGRGWGFFGRASISDGNPTPYLYFLSAGIGGDSPCGCHRGDTFGLGWYYTGVSKEFGSVARTKFGPRDGGGVELFYNYQVTPWLNVTPDVQVLKPGLSRFSETAFVYGLRVKMEL